MTLVIKTPGTKCMFPGRVYGSVVADPEVITSLRSQTYITTCLQTGVSVTCHPPSPLGSEEVTDEPTFRELRTVLRRLGGVGIEPSWRREQMTIATAILESMLTCPECGRSTLEEMPPDSCRLFHECVECLSLLRPKAEDCCVFCS